jgi:predicted nucleotide-binding protein (sugar kinase/HSP70/actin superfamily)
MVEKRSDPLAGRTLYIPTMCSGSAVLVAAAFRAHGVDASPCPESDARTRELAARHCTGDECYPQIVTMGDFIKVTEQESFRVENTAFFMPTGGGPCRFGQYNHLVKRMLGKLDLAGVPIVTPSFEESYRELGENGSEIMHYVWWGLIAGDLLRKMLHRTRPYEREAGSSDRVYREAIARVEASLEQPGRTKKQAFRELEEALKACRRSFDGIAADYSKDRLLIGMVGEIFCRLNTFSNDDMVRSIEAAGGEVWLADICDWIYYGNYWGQEELRSFGNRWSGAYVKGWLSDLVQHREEHRLLAIFADALVGWEEPVKVEELLDRAQPYLEPHAALGEMILNLGKSVWLQEKGADGILDISPFSCMNGVVCEAIYPKLSRDLDGIPIRIFYFDGTQGNLDDDVAIFMEMAAHYRDRKRHKRRWPAVFETHADCPLTA